MQDWQRVLGIATTAEELQDEIDRAEGMIYLARKLGKPVPDQLVVSVEAAKRKLAEAIASSESGEG